MECNCSKGTAFLTAVLLFLMGIVFSIPSDLKAQQKPWSEKLNPPFYQLKMEQLKRHLQQNNTSHFNGEQLSPVKSGVDLPSLSDEYTAFIDDQSWNRNSNPNPSQNFALFKQGRPAGNIDGDANGTNDYVVSSPARDERTPALEDQVWKTAVFYGDNTTGTPDQIVYRRLVPVGDINGDGYADAVAYEPGFLEHPSTDDDTPYIYTGSSSGYQKTSVVFQGMGEKMIPFQDINNDGFDDVFMYSPYDGDFFITWGRTLQSSDFYPQDFSSLLTSNNKSIAVDDIDGDTFTEIVELSGYSDTGGQVVVFEVDTAAQSMAANDAVTTEQSFSYSAFDESADSNHLNLVDYDGDGYLEILIGHEWVDQKYLVPYDATNLQYQNTGITLFNGPLYPMGDLNNDGHDDFVIADTTKSNNQAHIAYGPDDVNTKLSLDVPLKGVNGTDLGWEWGANLKMQGVFGDLTGDGVDDLLISHFEFDNTSPTVGRRIVNGIQSGSETHSSSFHQYSLENFFSGVAATEEVGDLNDDGIADFAIGFFNLNKVEIFFGGSTISSTPDKTITLNYSPMGLAGGDFNNDGVDDLVIPGGTENQSSATLSIFFGGPSMDVTADNTISSSNFQSVDYPALVNAVNVGDVNNDGIEDFFIGSGPAANATNSDDLNDREFINDLYLFFGSSSIDTKTGPDITISVAPTGSQYMWAGESGAGLGDINADGVDDFAVGVPFVPNQNNGSTGQVQIYNGTSSPSFSSPDVTLNAPESTTGFGWSVTAGDFTGDGHNDMGVSAINVYSEMTDTPPLIQIYHGGTAFDTQPDRSLAIPDFRFYNEVSDAGVLTQNRGQIESVTDFTNDGKDELVAGTGDRNSHAALYTFNSANAVPEIAIKAPNKGAGLGGSHGMAVGDFNNDGQVDLVLSQPNDNNDAFRSSRVYRYGLPKPLAITKVEDVPDDQGNRIRVHAGGFFMDALSQNIYGFDSWSVWRMTENGGWTNVKTVSPSNEGAQFVDVTVNKNQPTGIDSVDNSYVFRLEIFESEGGVIARSDTASGRAYDNVAPSSVSSVNIKEENGDQILSWQPEGYQDIREYLVYETDATGSTVRKILGRSTSTNFLLQNNFEGVQNFGIKARDVNNNIGTASAPVTGIFPQTQSYNIKEGWSLIGLPVEAGPGDIDSLMSLVSNGAIYSYNGTYQQVDDIQAGQGYWAKFSTQELQELTGLPETELTLSLKKGWNMISGVGGALDVADIKDKNGVIVPGTVYSFDQSYAQADTIRPGAGYWIRASEAASITLTHPELLANSKAAKEKPALAKSSEQVEDPFDELIISSGDYQRTLYFGDKLPENTKMASYSLPPLPPGPVFDARFKNDTRLIEGNDLYVKINKLPETAVTVETQMQSMAEYSHFTVKEYADGQLLKKYRVGTNKEFRLAHSETDLVQMSPANGSSVSGSKLPDSFKLKQNYPNPFNPTTQIRYSVPEATEVTLEVFNILGKRVATLVDEQKDPGNYQVTFDGANLASGIYLYRLQAGSYVATRKLILAK
ncbi:FG-GAP-like repeat-containing protein [Fodinibius halophilus]|uniref:T9SS type A sorting domain-containing protein n=1 Tax=Fodinibius halophilus TaxID=1736908 RepID=A0A6M1TDP3_9BACT|nr:FG-GAP-like repeat-containing protein [Fodinibius halophilus]NGP88934.1 T9SS type A sorting domain-containing protein [Fodinibius halophilus]